MLARKLVVAIAHFSVPMPPRSGYSQGLSSPQGAFDMEVSWPVVAPRKPNLHDRKAIRVSLSHRGTPGG